MAWFITSCPPSYTSQSRLQRRRLVQHALNALSIAQPLSKLLENAAITTDHLKLGILQRGGHYAAIFQNTGLMRFNLSHHLLLMNFQVHTEFFEVTGFFRHVVISLELLYQARRFCFSHSFTVISLRMAHSLFTFGICKHHGLTGIRFRQTQLFFAHGFCFKTLLQHPNLGHSSFFVSLRCCRFNICAGETVRTNSRRLSLFNLSFSQPIGGRHSLTTTSPFFIRNGLLLSRVQLRLSRYANLFSF